MKKFLSAAIVFLTVFISTIALAVDMRVLEIDYATPPTNGQVPVYDSTSVTWKPGALGVSGGGTGITSYAQGDMLYASAVDTLAKLAKNTSATRYLSNTGTSNNPAWAQVGLTNGVTGILPVTNGGTGLGGVGLPNDLVTVNSLGTTYSLRTLATGTTGTDFAAVISAGAVTFNLPDTGTGVRGVVSTGIQNIAGAKTFTSALSVPDDAYAVGWDASVAVPTKNAVYDKIQAIIAAYTALISDTAYAVSWDAVTTIAPSKNAVYDKLEAMVTAYTALVSDTAYAVSWDAVTSIAPSKNAVYDKLEAMVTAYTALVSDTVFATSWDGVTTIAPSKNAVFDKFNAEVGVIKMYGGSAAPTGHLLCDGSSQLRASFPALFAVIGTTYGSVDATHFTLPDLRQRFPLGKAAAGTGSTLGGTGGVIDHAHTVPGHFHGMGTGATLNITSGGTHTTSISHDHAAVTSGAGSAHSHGSTFGGGATLLSFVGAGGTTGLAAGATVNGAASTASESAHTHSVDLPNFSGNSSDTGAHTHTAGTFAGSIGLVTGGVDGNAAQNTGNVSGTAANSNPPFQVVNYIIVSGV